MNTQRNLNPRVNEEVFAKAVTRRLSEGAEDLPHDITERLKAARAMAASRRRIVAVQAPGRASISGGEATLNWNDGEGWWNRLASVLPLIALVAGLITIGVLQDEMRAQEIAEVDAELLIDDLPPQAYTDPGFAQFVRSNRVN
jgi:hypothetical protein